MEHMQTLVALRHLTHMVEQMQETIERLAESVAALHQSVADIQEELRWETESELSEASTESAQSAPATFSGTMGP